METVLITGANRGLGLEFVHQYALTGAKVLACCREPTHAIELLGMQSKYPNIQIYTLDLADVQSIQSLAAQIEEPIDILINNAGYLESGERLENISSSVFIKTFLVNAFGPIKMVEAFTHHLKKSHKKLVVCISSRVGSIGENLSGKYYSYWASKAALNMLMKNAAIELADDDIHFLLLHPGWVKTRMGGETAPTEIADSIKGMRQVIDEYQPISGEVKFYSFEGQAIAW